MNKTINALSIAAAVCLTLGGVARAGSMGYPETASYSTTDLDTTAACPAPEVVGEPAIAERSVVTEPDFVDRRVVTDPALVERRVVTQPALVERRVVTQPALVERRVVVTRPAFVERRVVATEPEYIGERDESLGERIVKFPARAAYTAVRSPIIVGETVAGRREVVSERGFFNGGARTVYRNDDIRYRPATRRLSSRTVYRTEAAPVRVVRRAGYTLERGAETTGRTVVRTGRTIVRTPVIIGETVTGRRQVINEEGCPIAR